MIRGENSRITMGVEGGLAVTSAVPFVVLLPTPVIIVCQIRRNKRVHDDVKWA